ncbi:ribonuclease E/G [uncultured Ferrovibrio sp.]|jgi:ribonuclease E|uniref:Rne/Rng family ribonuclease n=1 Tax=uncultured Ferrovibrio sp. TaxID=1576913 RepID=UPI00261A345F|nr:ribonuclease E/G [uncultured Ferrovibrio sp.]
MGMRMLIDATHLEETRVVVVKGTRLEEFDYETSTKQVLKGNIYLARVTRVEPSLQAAFVEYGGNRHGFLAFSEIHPDYYQIPIADREALLAQQAEEEARAAEAEEAELAEQEAREAARAAKAERGDDGDVDADGAEEGSGESGGIETLDSDYDTVEEITPDAPALASDDAGDDASDETDTDDAGDNSSTDADSTGEQERGDVAVADAAETQDAAQEAEQSESVAAPAYWNVPASAASAPAIAAEVEPEENGEANVDAEDAAAEGAADEHGEASAEGAAEADGKGEDNGKSDDHDEGRRRRRANAFRRYKIQEVIKRRQIMLVQVVKEERGNKGAALTTYLSLAGRYCVLMPNTARGGGISRKIQSQADRKRLKAITAELDIPEGMGVIVRTAGMERSKQEIKRDFEFLLRTWDNIRELTLESQAPCLIYEEAGLIKRSIRDLYSDQIDEVLVEGEQGYRFAKDFMQMLMPSHADRVKLYQDKIPLFHRYQVEQQLDGMFSPTVQLKSGGYIVINPTEALVSIDVNSGKSTREHNIEETAYKTNLEAAEEIARQLRLRDLAGLVVIDFIDMEENRNIRKVEQRLKECLRNDRARIQVGRISAFGLLEMSRQRLRPSLIESSTMPCPHCQGRGYVRSIESTALQVLRAIEEEGIRDRSSEITVSVSAEVAIYLLNHKRERISDIERRYVMRVIIAADASLVPPDYRIERSKTRQPGEVNRPELASKNDGQRPITQETAYAAETDEDAGETEADEAQAQDTAEGEEDGAGEGRRRRRRRRRRGRRDDTARGETEAASAEEGDDSAGEADEAGADAEASDDEAGEAAEAQNGEQGEGEGEGRRRRRGRRGGRRRRRGEGEGERAASEPLDSERQDDDRSGMMTPAAIGAMLDGVPAYEFDEEDAAPATKPQDSTSQDSASQDSEPQASKPQESPAAAAVSVHVEPPPPVVTDDVVLPETAPAETPVPPAAPSPVPPAAEQITTGPVFETVVIRPDGETEKPAEPPAPKKGWWRR